MADFFTIRHSFNSGDLISIMAGLRQIWSSTGKKIKILQRINLPAYYYEGQVSVIKDKEGSSVCMNEMMFFMIKPLVEAQEYIESFEVWEGQAFDLDYDLTRDTKSIPMPAGTMHSWYEAVFPQTSTDLSVPWLSANKSSISVGYYSDKILVNRSQRYYNPYVSYYFLKQYEDRLLFSGTQDECDSFCGQWNLTIRRLDEVDNFYQLAQIIQWCKFGIYNQSLNFHIADALKAPRILELCAAFPNTFITGANGYQFYRQAALEFFVNKLINE